jgi:serine/threonine-protein kinase RIO1
LIWEKPYLIDFSQAITFEHPFAKEFFERDVENINNFFKKFGVKVERLVIE